MRTYSCLPGTPALVLVLDQAGPPRLLDGGPFGWGKDYIGPGSRLLARALMVDVLGPMQTLRADRLATRLVYRALRPGKFDAPMALTDLDIRQHVEAIEATEQQVAGARQLAARDVPTPAIEGGIGVGGGRIVIGQNDWSKK